MDQCEIEFTDGSFTLPGPYSVTIAHTIDFNLKYNITNANGDSMEKEYLKI